MQVVVGVVMVAGWPIAHHVWAGNTRDSATVKEVIRDLAQRFRFRRDCVRRRPGHGHQIQLGDAQEKEEHGFLVGMTRRQNPEAETLIDRVDESKWIDCPMGINAREKKEPPRTRVQEVTCDREGVRVFVVDSDERRAYEERQRDQGDGACPRGIAEGADARHQGKLKQPEKIGAAVERALQRNHGYRYYAWELRDGCLEIFEHPVNLPREKKYEGKYLIQTDQADITPEEAVQYYKDLNEVERGFRSLKDPLGMRPIWHHVGATREGAHLRRRVGVLIERMLERTLKDAGATALCAVRTGSIEDDSPRPIPRERKAPQRSDPRLVAGSPGSQSPEADQTTVRRPRRRATKPQPSDQSKIQSLRRKELRRHLLNMG